MITLIIGIALIGFVIWAITTYIPMEPIFKNAIILIGVILVVFYIMRVLGFHDIPVR